MRVSQEDLNRVRQRADEAAARARRAEGEDVVIDGPRRLLLRAPGGAYFALLVSDDGTLSTVNVGNNL